MASDEAATAPLVFIDTETCGLNPEIHGIWEIAMIRREPDGSEAEKVLQVNCDFGKADLIALKIGKYHDRFHRATAFEQRTAARLTEEWTRGAHMVGAVVGFDDNRLERLLRSQGYCPAWHYHVIDVEALCVGYLQGIRRGEQEALSPPWSSKELTALMGVEMPTEDERHTALGDARWAQRLYDRAMQGG